jgi:hypothetical protein
VKTIRQQTKGGLNTKENIEGLKNSVNGCRQVPAGGSAWQDTLENGIIHRLPSETGLGFFPALFFFLPGK